VHVRVSLRCCQPSHVDPHITIGLVMKLEVQFSSNQSHSGRVREMTSLSGGALCQLVVLIHRRCCILGTQVEPCLSVIGREK
jgi:hypothetical protein